MRGLNTPPLNPLSLFMNLSELKLKPINEISTIADNLKVENVGRLKKQELLFAILKIQA